MKISNFNKGFTLIELLAVMVVLGTVGTVIGAILSSSLRNTSKTDIMNDVKQNGYFAIAQMTKTLRFAKSLNSPYPCPLPTPPIPASGSISVTSVDGVTTIFACDNSSHKITVAQGAGSPVPILDTSAVITDTCSFTCTQDSSSNYPIIDINFSLTQSNSSSFAEKTASATAVPFQTSVTLMNVSR